MVVTLNVWQVSQDGQHQPRADWGQQTQGHDPGRGVHGATVQGRQPTDVCLGDSTKVSVLCNVAKL